LRAVGVYTKNFLHSQFVIIVAQHAYIAGGAVIDVVLAMLEDTSG